MSLPSSPLSPEAELCMRALSVLDKSECCVPDLAVHPKIISRALLLLAYKPVRRPKHWYPCELPIWFEIASKSLSTLASHIKEPEHAARVRECLDDGLYDVVRFSCRSYRASAAPFLSTVAELLVASHHNSPRACASLCKIASACPVPATRAMAVKALATLAFGKHKDDIAKVALRDVDAFVRATAHSALAELRTHVEEAAPSSSPESKV